MTMIAQASIPGSAPTARIACAPEGLGAAPGPDRWAGIKRDYTDADVKKLRGSVTVRHTLAELGARRLWSLLHSEPYVNSLGAFTGNQAMQMVRAGLKAIYLSGWQVAADANNAGQMYPDQSLYPANSVPEVVRKINNTFRRADQIQTMEGKGDTHWFAPIVADAEAGFGGPLNAFELMKAMIEAGAAGVHFEDQLASEKKCGHLGGKVLLPIQQFVRTLNAARLAADVEGVPTILVARTDAHSAQLLTADVDPRDRPFLTGERTPEGFFRIKPGMGVDYAIVRGLAYAPYADLLWWETSEPNLEEAERFAKAIHAQFPGRRSTRSSRASCSPTTAHPRSTGARSWTRRRSRSSRSASAAWATSSSSSPSPGSTRSTTRPSSSRAAIARAAWRRTRNCSRPSSRRKRRATPRRATSAKSARPISMRSRSRSRAASPRPPRWRARPSTTSSTTTPARPTPRRPTDGADSAPPRGARGHSGRPGTPGRPIFADKKNGPGLGRITAGPA